MDRLPNRCGRGCGPDYTLTPFLGHRREDLDLADTGQDRLYAVTSRSTCSGSLFFSLSSLFSLLSLFSLFSLLSLFSLSSLFSLFSLSSLFLSSLSLLSSYGIGVFYATCILAIHSLSERTSSGASRAETVEPNSDDASWQGHEKKNKSWAAPSD